MKIIKLPNGGTCEYTNDNNDLNDCKRWYLNGHLHRENGPAIEYDNGDKVWYLNGQLHRENGPAVEFASGHKEWWINYKLLPCKTQKQFEQLMRLKVFW
jgi:hypothetical protein